MCRVVKKVVHFFLLLTVLILFLCCCNFISCSCLRDSYLRSRPYDSAVGMSGLASALPEQHPTSVTAVDVDSSMTSVAVGTDRQLGRSSPASVDHSTDCWYYSISLWETKEKVSPWFHPFH